MADLVELLLTAPAGAALLQSLEIAHRDDVPWFESSPTSDPAAVRSAAEAIRRLGPGPILREAVAAADRYAGPWRSDAPHHLANGYRLAKVRTPIAEAIADHFGDALLATCDLGAQEWWSSAYEARHLQPLFGPDWDVYCCGEFTWQGFWTVTSPPAEVHEELIGAWELFPEPITRWHLPVVADARVLEIPSAAAWAQLVAMHPRLPDRLHGGWELPGPNQHLRHILEVEAVSGGAGARHGVRVVMPDWASVAAAYDGVHLSWAGMLGAEGHVVPVPELGPDVVTMLRYWRSERTLWLRDVFGDPEPLPVPTRECDAEPAIDEAIRQAADLRALRTFLRREQAISGGTA